MAHFCATHPTGEGAPQYTCLSGTPEIALAYLCAAALLTGFSSPHEGSPGQTLRAPTNVQSLAWLQARSAGAIVKVTQDPEEELEHASPVASSRVKPRAVEAMPKTKR
jgi:hypothetical protein